MPSIRERSAPRSRLMIRIAVAMGFIFAAYLYVAHVEARDAARTASAAHALALVRANKASEALAETVSAERNLGSSPELSRALWASLMAGGGRHGQKALLRRALAFTPSDPSFSLMFSKDDRFLAALDGDSVSVWNVDNNTHVLTTEASDRFVGYWRIGAQHIGLLESYQYYDLVNATIDLPDNYRYAQPAKDSLTGIAPGGDWGYRVLAYAADRSDYPIKLVNLHTSEKREVDVDYLGRGTVAVNDDATRIAASDGAKAELWNARTRERIASFTGGEHLQFSKALNAIAVVRHDGGIALIDADTGKREFAIAGASHILAVADDPKGFWFAVATKDKILVYRGLNDRNVIAIAEREVSRAPATSH
jgi:hypothetical protein